MIVANLSHSIQWVHQKYGISDISLISIFDIGFIKKTSSEVLSLTIFMITISQ